MRVTRNYAWTWRLLGFIAVWTGVPGGLAQCELQKLEEDGGPDEEGLGWTIAMDGALLAVGAPADYIDQDTSGSVYLFEWVGGRWAFSQKIICDPSPWYANFGEAVALDGQRLAVGSPWDDGISKGTGAVYIFERHGGHWLRVAKLFAADGREGDWFGDCVALRGDRLLVGARYRRRAYLFERDDLGVWQQTQVFRGDQRTFRLGSSVALDDGRVAIGDPDDFEKGNWSGAAWVFEEQADGTWSKLKLFGSDQKSMWKFGFSVELRGGTLFVGAVSRRPDPGVYIFQRDDAGMWRETDILVPADPKNAGWFGQALSISGRTLVVGASRDFNDGAFTGAAYVFTEQSDGRWAQAGKLIPSDGGWQDEFGTAVSVRGDTAVVGAPWHMGDGFIPGAAYVYRAGPDDDGDGVMDACECPGDLDGDRDVDLADLAALLTHWGAPCPK